MTTKTTVFAITGYLNFLGELKQSEGGTLYRNIILGRGENELAYSAVLFGAAAKLAHYELKKGDKVRLTNIELQPDRTTDNFKQNASPTSSPSLLLTGKLLKSGAT